MNKQRFPLSALVLGAAVLVSLNAPAAAVATDGDGVWPIETPATISFGDTENYGSTPRRPDVPATVGFGNPAEQDGPVVAASSSIVDAERLELREEALAEQRERGAAMLARSQREGGAASAAGMH